MFVQDFYQLKGGDCLCYTYFNVSLCIRKVTVNDVNRN